MISPTVDPKTECSYKDKCYRRKQNHFEEFAHPHLDELLEKIGENEVHVPHGYLPKVSFATLKFQLELVKQIKNKLVENPPCAKKRKSNNDSEDASLIEISPNASPAKASSSRNHMNNLTLASQFGQSVRSKIRISIARKLELAKPYNILYTSVDDDPAMKNDRLTVTFAELIDSSLGLLENSLFINFMVEFGWILACYYVMGHRGKPITLIYGAADEDLSSRFDHFLVHDMVKPPSPFGTHHTKMMVFSYLDKSIRVVVCTANLVESDWKNKTQGVWISPKCDEIIDCSDESLGDSVTHFKRDLLKYLRSYNLPSLEPWIEKVKKADMSEIKVLFVASVPGSHTSPNLWGQQALRKALSNHDPSGESDSYSVIAQCSSIGSLGKTPDAWLLGDILTTFSTNSSCSINRRPNINLIYPSFTNVERCADGLLGGGCLPYTSNVHLKQEWLSSFMCHWVSERIGRSRAIPHIKSYTRVSPDYSKISYFLLTSANLSKAAWGTISKKESINILSYEAGVLLLPKFLVGDNYFPIKEELSTDTTPLFTLPYDVPLTPYSSNDIPWFIDNLPTD